MITTKLNLILCMFFISPILGMKKEEINDTTSYSSIIDQLTFKRNNIAWLEQMRTNPKVKSLYKSYSLNRTNPKDILTPKMLIRRQVNMTIGIISETFPLSLNFTTIQENLERIKLSPCYAHQFKKQLIQLFVNKIQYILKHSESSLTKNRLIELQSAYLETAAFELNIDSEFENAFSEIESKLS